MTVAHPAALADLDLFAVWCSAELASDRLDPFSFEHRMAVYRELIRASNPVGAFGADNARSPLWGLMFQLQWQFRTGRLGPDSRATDRIDPDAPWGYGNYTLSLIPWLGAVEAGVVAPRAIGGPPGASMFDYVVDDRVPADLAAGVSAWADFFRRAVLVQPGEDQEPVRRELWRAHKVCLDVVARRLAEPDVAACAALPLRELTFLRGWCRMVDFLWAASWPTDFTFMTEYGLRVLPERQLGDGHETEPLPDKVRGNVANILGLARTPQRRYDINLRLWRRIMRTRAAREDVVALLDALFNPRPANRGKRAQALVYLLKP